VITANSFYLLTQLKMLAISCWDTRAKTHDFNYVVVTFQKKINRSKYIRLRENEAILKARLDVVKKEKNQ